MRRWWRVVCIGVLAGSALGVCACALYDLWCFQPALADMRAALRAAPAEDRDPPVLAAELIRFEAHGDTVPYTARLLLRRVDAGQAPGSAWSWQLRYTLWCSLVDWHTSERERTAAIASFAVTGPQRHGLVETAGSLFGQPPSKLSPSETAVLVLLISAPSLGARALPAGDGLLARYEASVRAGAWRPDASAARTGRP